MTRTKLFLLLAGAGLMLLLPEHGHGAIHAVFGIDDLLIGGALGLGSAAAGRALSSGDRGASQEQIQAAVDQLKSIGMPDAEARQVVLQHYQQQGEVTPEMEQAILSPDSAAAGVETDPHYKQAEMQALTELQRVGDEGGLTLTDKATLEDTLGRVNRQARGAREANLSAVRARGQLGSGLELSAMNDADQSAIEQAHQDSLRIAGQAQDRALEALMKSGSLAGDMENRDFGEDFKKASAADELAKFNTQTRQKVQTANVNRANEAQATNLQAKQSVADRNVDIGNKETIYNTEKNREAAQDKLDQAKAIAAAQTQQAQQSSQNAKQTQDLVSNVGSGAVKLYGAGIASRKKNDDEEEF
jgi:hypothetical protein